MYNQEAINPPAPDTRFYTVRQAAERLGVSTSTIRRWGKEGVLPLCRVGKRLVRVRPRDLEAIIT